MLKGCVIFLLFVFFAFINPSRTFAIVDPLNTPNNKYGIHIINEDDLDDAAKLVNSNEGEWGYITLVIQDDDMDEQKWQRVFDKMRKLKLIPIVRLSTHPIVNIWAKPTSETVPKWSNFLSSLVWVVKNRYVILFNEPNQAKEWEGKVNPQEYAGFVESFYHELKSKSEDFFILPAGFDVAATNTRETMDVINFWQSMVKADPHVFQLFDGWTSHSYPNPNFSGSPNKSGRMTVKSYEWEINYLQKYGLKKDIPIFITETGWIHKEGEKSKVLGYTSEEISKFFDFSFTNVWTNLKIVAITPFVLNYQNQPFDHFSWKKTNSEFYSQYKAVQNLPKLAGQPAQEKASLIQDALFPEFLIAGVDIPFSLTIKNTGQSIWDVNMGYSVISNSDNGIIKVGTFAQTKPRENVYLKGSFNVLPGTSFVKINIALAYNKSIFGEVFKKNIRPLNIFGSNSLKNEMFNYFFYSRSL